MAVLHSLFQAEQTPVEHVLTFETHLKRSNDKCDAVGYFPLGIPIKTNKPLKTSEEENCLQSYLP